MFLVLGLNALNAQNILPPFEHNITSEDSIKIKTILEVTKDFDFSIVLKMRNNWFNAVNNSIIGFKNQNWEYKLLLSERKIRKTKIRKVDTLINLTVRNNLCDSILSDLKNNYLFSMDVDSLNIDEKLVYDSLTKDYKIWSLMVDDGTNYSFYIITKDKIRKVSNYAPEYLFEKIPHIIQRKYFINCKNSFLRLNKE